MRIFGWAADNSGCGWYRLRQPLGTLARQGRADTKVSEIWDELFCRRVDVVVGQRVSNDGASQRWQAMAALPKNRRPLLVYEIDDDLLSVSGDNEISSGYYNQPKMAQRIRDNIRAADMVTVTTEALGAAMREHMRPEQYLAVLPNYIPQTLLERPLGALSRTGQPLVVGWAGSATHAADVALVADSLRRLWARKLRQGTNMAFEYHVIGTDYLPRSLYKEGAARFTPWLDSVEGYYRAVDFNIGLAPLRAGTFNRSKSPIKALEYAAMGIPIIASDAGPYPTFVENGENGLLIRQDYQWYNAIWRLLTSPDERVHMGEIARRDARRHTIEEHAREWIKAYERGIRHALQQ